MGTQGAVPGVPASHAAGSRQERGPAVSEPVSGSVVPSGSGGLSRYDQSGRQLDWRTRQELSRIEQERSLTRAVVDAAEEEEAHAVGQVLAHGERLAHQAVGGLQRLNREIEETSRHNSGLEFGCREIESVFAVAAAQHIANYMTRRR